MWSPKRTNSDSPGLGGGLNVKLNWPYLLLQLVCDIDLLNYPNIRTYHCAGYNRLVFYLDEAELYNYIHVILRPQSLFLLP